MCNLSFNTFKLNLGGSVLTNSAVHSVKLFRFGSRARRSALMLCASGSISQKCKRERVALEIFAFSAATKALLFVAWTRFNIPPRVYKVSGPGSAKLRRPYFVFRPDIVLFLSLISDAGCDRLPVIRFPDYGITQDRIAPVQFPENYKKSRRKDSQFIN